MKPGPRPAAALFALSAAAACATLSRPETKTDPLASPEGRCLLSFSKFFSAASSGPNCQTDAECEGVEVSLDGLSALSPHPSTAGLPPETVKALAPPSGPCWFPISREVAANGPGREAVTAFRTACPLQPDAGAGPWPVVCVAGRCRADSVTARTDSCAAMQRAGVNMEATFQALFLRPDAGQRGASPR